MIMGEKKNILVVGSLNMDVTVSLQRIPQVGETVLGDSLCYTGGGKGANQACACAKLGASITMLGSVGADDNGRQLIKNLKSCGVDTSHIQQLPTEPTGTALIYVAESGKNNIVVVPGANAATSVAYLQQHTEAFQDCNYLLVQMEIPIESVLYAVKKAKELGKTVILNPAPAPEPSNMLLELLGCVDFITPNETELQMLTGWEGEFSLSQLQEKAGELMKKGPSAVIATLGSAGSMLFNKDGNTYTVTPRDVPVVDTVAAGDCFNGAFVVGLSEGLTVPKAMQFAGSAATIAVTRKGAQDSIPLRQEVDEFINSP